MTLASCTVSETVVSGGAVIWNMDRLTMRNSLVDGWCRTEDGSATTSDGYNLESPGNSCSFDVEKGDQVEVSVDDLGLEWILADNGGPTETQALLPGSVAIDVIPETECVNVEGELLTADQRGEPRDMLCDVGAFEVQP